MNQVKYSVIVPVFNVEKYIGDCIESILKQSITNFELILVDDASTDNSLDIINRYKNDKRVKIYSNKKNVGVSETRNYGISVSSGEYIIFVDSDDYVSEHLLEKINNYDQDIIYYDYFEVDDVTGEKKRKKTCNDSYNKIKKINISSVSLCACRKKIYEDFDIKFPKNLVHEDDEVSYRLAFHSKNCGYIEEPLYHYRVNRSGSIMSNKTCTMIHDLFIVTKRNIDYFSKIMNYDDFAFFVREICVEKFFDYLIYEICYEKKYKDLIKYKRFVIKTLNNTKINWHKSKYFETKNMILNFFRRSLKYCLFLTLYYAKPFRTIIMNKINHSNIN